VALGARTFQELMLTAGSSSPFAKREVELKGYEGPSTAWGISFDALQEFLEGRP